MVDYKIASKKILKGIQIIFFSLCLVFITNYYFESKENIAGIVVKANWKYLIFSIISWQIVSLIIPLFSYIVLKCLKCRVSYEFMLKIYLKRLPAKYLPGGIWQTVARFYDLTQKGVKKNELSILIFYENFWSVVIAAFIGGGGVFYFTNEEFWGDIAYLIFFSSLLVIPGLYFMRKLKIVFSLKNYLKLSFISSIFWLFASFSFYFYINAFSTISIDDSFLSISSSYVFSWLIGFLSIFAPQGIGVFEVVMVKISTFSISIQEAIVLITGFRFIVFFSDLLIYLFGTFINRLFSDN